MTQLSSLLAQHDLRTTAPRQAVFAALQQASEPLSIHEIGQLCPSIDRTSIYRTLELFTRLNVATIVHVGWKKRYELSSEYQKHHHHHLICTSCGRITEINSHKLEHVIGLLSRTHSFTPSGHTFEITGICNRCS